MLTRKYSFHVNTGNVITLMLAYTTANSADCSGTWLFVPPTLHKQVQSWLTKNADTNTKSADEFCSKLTRQFQGIQMIVQKPNDIVRIPCGWLYMCLSQTPWMEVTYEWVEESNLHRCLLTYLHMVTKRTHTQKWQSKSIMKFLTFVLSEFPFRSHRHYK